MLNPRRIGLVSGMVVFALLMMLPHPSGLSAPAWGAAAVAIWMAIWWLTEAVPIPVTALIPLVLFPLVGAGTMREAALPYANPVIFLFMGGFLVALAMQRWDLHRRIALHLLSRVGARQISLIAGFMLVTAGLSMGLSNTAVTLMMPVSYTHLPLPPRCSV